MADYPSPPRGGMVKTEVSRGRLPLPGSPGPHSPSSPGPRRFSSAGFYRPPSPSHHPPSPRSPSSHRSTDGFHYHKSPAPGGRSASPPPKSSSQSRYPSFDSRDHAPEDGPYSRGGRYGSQSPSHPQGQSTSPIDPYTPLVRGSLRLEGVDFSKYEALKGSPEVQRSFTTAIRDDLICEAGHGVTREDILLRLTPGPIKTVVLDYNSPPRADGTPGPPALIDAEWCVDVEYAIASRNEHAQVQIAQALYEALASGDMLMRTTRSAYVRYLNPQADPAKIRVVPTCAGPKSPTPSPPRDREASPSAKYSPHQARDSYYDNSPTRYRY